MLIRLTESELIRPSSAAQTSEQESPHSRDDRTIIHGVEIPRRESVFILKCNIGTFMRIQRDLVSCTFLEIVDINATLKHA